MIEQDSFRGAFMRCHARVLRAGLERRRPRFDIQPGDNDFSQLLIAGQVNGQSDRAAENGQKADDVRRGHVEVEVGGEQAVDVDELPGRYDDVDYVAQKIGHHH